MNVHDMRRLFTYNHWANRRLLATARLLSLEEFTRDLGSSHASVRGTLVHIIGGQWVWLRLWLGEPSRQIAARSEAMWDVASFPDVASLEAAHDVVERDQIAFIDGLSDDQVASRISFESFQGEPRDEVLGELLQHVINHSTYHRGQVVTMLRQLNQIPPPTDYSLFIRQFPLT